ncbi:MAG TPA: hypothetical protein VI564_01280 [Candidatus Nanoarchaeia archaeon]|nr:hypothetical protein [Candidatus Nanoarchaeia archaeon]
MVKQIIKNKKIYFLCKECNFIYKNKNLAQKCEEWCRKFHSCNVKITKNVINP